MIARAPSVRQHMELHSILVPPTEDKIAAFNRLSKEAWAVAYQPQLRKGGCLHTQTTSNVAEQLWNALDCVRGAGDPLAAMYAVARYEQMRFESIREEAWDWNEYLVPSAHARLIAAKVRNEAYDLMPNKGILEWLGPSMLRAQIQGRNSDEKSVVCEVSCSHPVRHCTSQ